MTFWNGLVFASVVAAIAALLFVVVMRDREKREQYRESYDE